MKKLFAFFLCLIMVFSLVSCKWDQDALSQMENVKSDSAENNSINNNSYTQISDAEKAMQMY